MRYATQMVSIPPKHVCTCPTATWESTRRTRSVRSSACATRLPRAPEVRHPLAILTTRLTLPVEVTAHRDWQGLHEAPRRSTDDLPCDNVRFLFSENRRAEPEAHTSSTEYRHAHCRVDALALATHSGATHSGFGADSNRRPRPRCIGPSAR